MQWYTPIETADDFARAIRLGSTRESIYLDFKAALEKEKANAAIELARDIAQFANTLGGCLVFGVSERTDGDGRRVAEKFISVDRADLVLERVTSSVTNYLVPNTLSYSAIPIDLSTGDVVVVVNVPPSAKVVTVFDRQTNAIQFIRRNSRGKTYHNPAQLEAALMDGSRAKYLSFLDATGRESNPIVNVASPVSVYLSGRGWVRAQTSCRLAEFDTTTFGLEVGFVKPASANNPILVRIPYGLIREVWRVHDDVWLLLDVELHLRGNEIAFGAPD